MQYSIYLTGAKGVHRWTAYNWREFEKDLTRWMQCALSFKEDMEAGAVFFSHEGEELGFYIEEE